jgi:enoyl-CoA hydratase/carnithine racemase
MPAPSLQATACLALGLSGTGREGLGQRFPVGNVGPQVDDVVLPGSRLGAGTLARVPVGAFLVGRPTPAAREVGDDVGEAHGDDEIADRHHRVADGEDGGIPEEREYVIVALEVAPTAELERRQLVDLGHTSFDERAGPYRHPGVERDDTEVAEQAHSDDTHAGEMEVGRDHDCEHGERTDVHDQRATGVEPCREQERTDADPQRRPGAEIERHRVPWGSGERPPDRKPQHDGQADQDHEGEGTGRARRGGGPRNVWPPYIEVMEFEALLYEVDHGAATVTINRPERRNALSWTVMTELREALGAAKADPQVHVVVLTGAGDKAFCAGADLTGMAGGESYVDLHDARGELARLFRSMWELGKPIVAKVRGYALAGGFGLALACDMVIAADDAQFGTPEIDVGLWPYMITVPLIRSMPPKVALELMMTGRRVDATEAVRIGFVNRVVPVAELDAAVAELTTTLAAKSPAVMKLGRDSFYAVWDQSAEDSLRLLHPMLTITTATDDAAEGIAAFAEKRPPVWKGS